MGENEETNSKLMQTAFGHYMYVRIWGETMGGDIGGNPYRLVDQKLSENKDELTLFFEENEKCSIFKPVGTVRKGVDDDKLVVEHAEKIVWEFYYYGRPPSPETLYAIEYNLVDESHVHVTENGNWPRDEIIEIKNKMALDINVIPSEYRFKFKVDFSVEELIDLVIITLKPRRKISIKNVDKANGKITLTYKKFFRKEDFEMIFVKSTRGIVANFSTYVPELVEIIDREMAVLIER